MDRSKFAGTANARAARERADKPKQERDADMNHIATNTDPRTWDPKLDAVMAAPKHHKVIFENENLRVLEVTLEPQDEEPVHHHRWPSVFVFDSMAGPVYDRSPDGKELPPDRDVMQAIQAWDGKGPLRPGARNCSTALALTNIAARKEASRARAACSATGSGAPAMSISGSATAW